MQEIFGIVVFWQCLVHNALISNLKKQDLSKMYHYQVKTLRVEFEVVSQFKAKRLRTRMK